MDHYRLCVGGLDEAFGGRGVCLPRKVGDLVGLKSVDLDPGDGSRKELARDAGSGHHQDGGLVSRLELKHRKADRMKLGMEVKERLRSLTGQESGCVSQRKA